MKRSKKRQAQAEGHRKIITKAKSKSSARIRKLYGKRK